MISGGDVNGVPSDLRRLSESGSGSQVVFITYKSDGLLIAQLTSRMEGSAFGYANCRNPWSGSGKKRELFLSVGRDELSTTPGLRRGHVL
jgi:hypothetical protein